LCVGSCSLDFEASSFRRARGFFGGCQALLKSRTSAPAANLSK
jgi:hypothetical protein